MSEIIDRLRCALRGREDVELALLFGSVARGVARDESDLDVAVLAPGADLLSLAAALREAIGSEAKHRDPRAGDRAAAGQAATSFSTEKRTTNGR